MILDLIDRSIINERENMKIYKLNLSLKECIDKEYIVTNGIGGYASSTICSMNTRRYHGLLVAPLNIPAKRHVILSKIDESIEVTGKEKEIIYSNTSNNYISDGFKKLISVENRYYPKFTYDVNGVIVTKEVVMEYAKNTVVIKYSVKTKNNEVVLNLTPLLTFRNFHYLNRDISKDILRSVKKENISIKDVEYTKNTYTYNTDSDIKLKMIVSDSEYVSYENEGFKYFNDMYYVREEERGFDSTENLLIPGTYKVHIPKNVTKDIYVLATIENDLDFKYSINSPEDILKMEEKRLKNILDDSKLVYKYEQDILLKNDREELKALDDFKEMIINSSDQFIIKRDDYVSIIAGYHWFLDWMRDTLISFEGLLLKTKRFEEARSVLTLAIKDLNSGLIPNAYSEEENIPYYNSADSSLLLFEAVAKYIKYTNDYEFVHKNLYHELIKIIDNYKMGISLMNNNIYLDEDYLISSGSINIQNTWMDAIVNGKVVTPRNGKAVEINALWYNALKVLQSCAEKFKDLEKQVELNELARRCKISFNLEFRSKKGGLKDTVSDDKIRPNQLFAISLTHKIVDDPELVKDIIDIVSKKLLNRVGLKTLAKSEKLYVEEYSGSPEKRDFSYHQGITWPWLLMPYYHALEYAKDLIGSKKSEDMYKEFIEKTYKIYKKVIYQRPCINGITELNNSAFPYDPQGTITQAWSVAAIITILF